MMKSRWLAVALLALAVSWTVVVPATRSQNQDEFVIDGADAIVTRAAGISMALPTSLEPRFILDWADATNKAQVGAVPPEMPLVLEPRFILEWADRLVMRGIEMVPEEMPTLLQPRFVLQWADRSRERQLVYPCELVGEPDYPVISDLQVTGIQYTQATITWLTDEYADSLVEYGLAPGAYSWTAYDASFVGIHSITISDLTPGTRHYYRVGSTDRCANSAITDEYWFETPGDFHLYLPLVLR